MQIQFALPDGRTGTVDISIDLIVADIVTRVVLALAPPPPPPIPDVPDTRPAPPPGWTDIADVDQATALGLDLAGWEQLIHDFAAARHRPYLTRGELASFFATHR